ncbi:DUF418 domain-containing protein [Dactylosporangium sp. AC04546]|uniref:DUF418 domain-containing protein n=1 Tax=Dactylosporangium sp. AC04546 TaxID=2862460 RepID=UPI001EDF9CE8|nr:DUF418 domain-containing protein [Dactylosporangium sp. AC04546]WVK87719.1 DUF418 domain-containing protein [Dactylosporangium sp. AC04546]
MTQQLADRPTLTRRLLDVDALRGFALFGILIVNIWYFASGYAFHRVPDPAYGAPLDHGVHAVVAFVFEMKFYLLFSFLFGYSFTLQIDAADRAGAAFRPRFLRRVAGLFALGALHAVLLFHGDILTTYAVLGLILLALHRIRPRTALIVAGALVGLVVLFFAAMAFAAVPSVDEPAALANGAATTAALGGAPADVIAEHLRSLPTAIGGTVVLQAPVALAMFLVGLAVGRRRLLADPPAHRRGLLLIQAIGYPLGLAGAAAVVALGGISTMAGLAVSTLTSPLLAAAYAASMLSVFQTSAGRRLATALAPAGRMALTNYLMQSLVLALIFTGLGFGLIGEVPPLAVAAIAVAVFVVQLVASAAWLRSHRYGPVEWLLRALTIWSRPAWRR